jgi:hypothetical protein
VLAKSLLLLSFSYPFSVQLSGVPLLRFVSKFKEDSFSKIDRLVELHVKYLERV